MKVAVLMGSKSDWTVMSRAVRTLKIDTAVEVLSAHRCPIGVAQYVDESDADVFICGAGMAAHLAGAVAARTERPVVGVPLSCHPFQGQDALLATLQMPAGYPVATVAVDGAENAGLLAAQMLALSDEELATRVADYRQAKFLKMLQDDKEVKDLVKTM